MKTSEVVLVTANYRLGPFGFLSLGHPHCNGNQGLWDQLLVLKWVKENIAAFGGDENNVTLIGHGSGSVCASFHLISSKSIGLFARIVLMSGTLACPIFTQRHELADIGKSFAISQFSILQENPGEILEHLLEIDALEIMEKSAFMSDWAEMYPNPWLPGIDHDFVMGNPLDILEMGGFNKMPVMIGCVKDEGALFAKKLLKNPFLLDYFDHYFTNLAKILIFNTANPETKELTPLLKQIRNFYNKDSLEINDIVKLLNDANMVSSNHYFISLIKRESAQPVFMYDFDHNGDWKTLPNTWRSSFKTFTLRKLSIVDLDSNEPTDFIGHGEDLVYLFDQHDGKIAQSADDVQISDNFVQMLINFSRVSNPTPSPKCNISQTTNIGNRIIYLSFSVDPFLRNINWQPYQAENLGPIMQIDLRMELAKGSNQTAKKHFFWRKIYEDFPRDSFPIQLHSKPFTKRFKIVNK